MSRATLALVLGAAVGLAAGPLGLAGCGGGKVPPAPPPYRPAVKPAPEEPPRRAGPEVADCAPSNPATTPPSLPYDQRSIPEADKLAKEAIAALNASASNPDRISAEAQFTDAVAWFINALLADPYNVEATYNLAAAYARIKRPQCALNLLERLIQMRDHPSKKDQVEAKLDLLLGRKKKPLDPDFRDMRGDRRFRELIAGMCAGTDDPGCIFGNK